jgi:hypothetical protein
MLGAQARAAEYSAAKKALARQASHDAEEQKLPPAKLNTKTLDLVPLSLGPMSLSAFTRSAQSSRNKGSKAFVPLVFDHTSDSGAAGPETESGTQQTPSKQQSTPSSLRSSNGPSSNSSARPRVLMPTTNLPNSSLPPSGPRAMLQREVPTPDPYQPYSSRPHTMPASYHTPPRMHQPLMYADSLLYHSSPSHGLPQIAFGWPPMPMPGTPFPFAPIQPHTGYFESPPNLTTHSAPPPGEKKPARPIEIRAPRSPRPATPGVRVERFIFGPDDLSPSKQESKLAIRAGTMIAPERSPTQNSWKQDHNNISPALDRSGNRNSRPTPFARPSSTLSDISEQTCLPNPLRQYGVISIESPSPNPPLLWSTSSEIDSKMLTEGDDEETYDRTTKMQKFVAVQQVLSRQGKTVLNNQERSKNIATPQTPNLTSLSVDEPQQALPDDQSGHLSYLLLLAHPNAASYERARLDYALAFDPMEGRLDMPPVLSTLIPDICSDTGLRHEFAIGEDRWFDLKPVSLSERRKMRRAFEALTAKDARLLRRHPKSRQLTSEHNPAIDTTVDRLSNAHLPPHRAAEKSSGHLSHVPKEAPRVQLWRELQSAPWPHSNTGG